MKTSSKISSSPLREQATEALRKLICSGQVAAGAVLLEENLAEEFGVSRTPMREALHVLSDEGLLRKRDGRGYEVSSKGPPDSAPRNIKGSTKPSVIRHSLRDQAASVLRHKILSGEIAPTSVLREATLALELGISRTPMREALLILTREGLTSKRAGRGFVVTQLDAEEVRELYPLRALLEPEALRQSGIPDLDQLEALGYLNDQLSLEPIGARWIEMDVQWHELLVRGCKNRHLRSILDNLREHSLRYELAFLTAVGSSEPSTGQHKEILGHLGAGNLDLACRILADNMMVSLDPLLSWLDTRTTLGSESDH